LNDKKI